MASATAGNAQLWLSPSPRIALQHGLGELQHPLSGIDRQPADALGGRLRHRVARSQQEICAVGANRSGEGVAYPRLSVNELEKRA